jgi:UDP-glucose 4-epimerase
MHFGGQSSGEVSHEDPLLDFDVNARGTLLLLRWCERHGIKRVLFPSSQTVYGPSIGPLVEDAPKDFHSFYGASKSAAEGYLNLFGRRGGAPTIFRLFNVYGPGQNLANLRQGMVSIYLAFLLKGAPILVKGPLERFRDFVYVDDVVDVWLKALETPASYGRTYNVGSGRKTSVRELLDGLTEAYGCAPEAYPIVQAEGTPGDIAGNFADISRARRELGWEPRVDLPEGLRRMVAWAQGAGKVSVAASEGGE